LRDLPHQAVAVYDDVGEDPNDQQEDDDAERDAFDAVPRTLRGRSFALAGSSIPIRRADPVHCDARTRLLLLFDGRHLDVGGPSGRPVQLEGVVVHLQHRSVRVKSGLHHLIDMAADPTQITHYK
jgi:hypothetical protein